MACCSRGQLVKHRYTNRVMSLLMHVGAAQANTCLSLEWQRVPTVTQVREMYAARASHEARLPYLVSVRRAEEAARREYM